MADVPMPKDMSLEAVAKWVSFARYEDGYAFESDYRLARAVRALLRERVSLAADVAYDLWVESWDPARESAEQYGARNAEKRNEIISRVLGDEHEGGADAR